MSSSSFCKIVIHAGFVLDNLQVNVPYPINKNEILKKAVQISEILLKDGENNIIGGYSKALLKEIKKVEDYIKKIMVDTENYPYLCKHILVPGSSSKKLLLPNYTQRVVISPGI